MSQTTRPLARLQDLKIQSVADETLVYDNRTDKAYVLSASAAAVWEACNGKRTVKEIAQYLSGRTPTNEQVVWYALGQLNPLLEAPVTLPGEIAGMSRRQFLTRAGLAAGAVAVPVVVSMVAPKAAHAQSVTQFCCVCNNGASATVIDCTICFGFCADKNGEDECTDGECTTA